MKKVILDTDPGIDDALAVMLALSSPELEVLGITTVGGNVPAAAGAENARRIVEFCRRKDLPVYVGESRPLQRELVTAQDTHGQDGLGESNLPAPEEGYLEGGVDFILRTLRRHPGEVTVIALGPLTNIAVALERDREAFLGLAELIVMGGSAKSHGNCSQVAEYNFWADPHAADYVCRQIPSFTMVGLDVTRKIVLTPNHRELLRQFNTPAARLINKITRFYVDFHWAQERTLGCVLNDPLAVAACFMPELLKTKPYFVEVVTGGKAMGQSLVDFGYFYRKEPNARVCLEVDDRRFMSMFLKRMCPEFALEIDNYFAQVEKLEVQL